MTRLITRLLAVLLVPALLAGPTVASARPPAAVVDQIAFRHLPTGLGTTTDFTYDYDDVDFRARAWESHSADGGWRVDLDIDVMHAVSVQLDRERWTRGEVVRTARSARNTG